jgi:hypothetical protein
MITINPVTVTNIDLEEEILNDLGQELRKSEDFGVMCAVLEPFGYTVIDIAYGPDKKWIDVMSWFDSVCKGDYKEHNGTWLIERPEDAILFKLKWL